MREELVAKRYLCAKIAGPLILEYYLLVSPLAEDLEIYGVKIVERRSGVAAIAPGLTTSGRKILHLIDLLSKGTVRTEVLRPHRSWLHRTADAAKCSTAVPEYFGHRLPDSAYR